MASRIRLRDRFRRFFSDRQTTADALRPSVRCLATELLEDRRLLTASGYAAHTEKLWLDGESVDRIECFADESVEAADPASYADIESTIEGTPGETAANAKAKAAAVIDDLVAAGTLVPCSDGSFFVVHPDPAPLDVLSFNANAADTTNADELWFGGTLGLNLTGAGVSVGVWDLGAVRDTHEKFSNSPNRVIVVDQVEFSDHATHVAGTIGASGIGTGPDAPRARGMAPHATIRSRDRENEAVEMAADASAGLIDLTNHSYGNLRGWTNRLTFEDLPISTWMGDRDNYNGEDPAFGKYDAGNGAVDSSSHLKFGYPEVVSPRDLDGLLYDYPNVLSIWAAGNDRKQAFSGTESYPDRYQTYRSNGPEGPGWYSVTVDNFPPPGRDGDANLPYDTLPQQQVAKNTLVVGAVGDVTADPYETADVQMTGFSSWGPTDDGRIKPDVVANGDGLTSPVAFVPDTDPPVASNDSYGADSGTSMAAPNVTGTAALLLEYYRELGYPNVEGFDDSPRSATTKAVLIHTAFDVGNIGPDYRYGWGLVDASAAARFLEKAYLDNSSGNFGEWGNALIQSSYEGTPRELKVLSDGSGPLKVTMVWTDPAGPAQDPDILDDRTKVLVHDLDLSVIGPGETYYPWTLDVEKPDESAIRTRRNDVDNVEQVLIDAPAPGIYTIHVGHSGGTFAQDYSLLLSGISPTSALPADKWTVIIHGLSSEEYDTLITPADGNDAWMWDLAQRIRHESVDPVTSQRNVAIHRMNTFAPFEQIISPGLTDWDDAGWPSATIDVLHPDYHHVLLFDWVEVSNYGPVDTPWPIDGLLVQPPPGTFGDDGYAEASADFLYALALAYNIGDKIHAVIGYSRGAVVASEFAQRQIADGLVETDIEQVIYLDAEGGGDSESHSTPLISVYDDDEYWAWITAITDNYYSTAMDGFGGHYVKGARNFNDGNQYGHVDFYHYLIGDLDNGARDGLFVKDGRIVTNDTPTSPDGPQSDSTAARFDPPEHLEVFNGRFEFGSTAGWSYHGGDGAGVVEDDGLGNHYLRLNQGNYRRVHNWMYIPADAKSVAFDYWRKTEGDETLRVLLGDVPLGKVHLDVKDDGFRHESFVIPDSISLPAVEKLTFIITPVDQIGAVVWIDNVQLTKRDVGELDDPWFGVDGITFHDFGYVGNAAYDVAVRPDDKIVAVGRVGNLNHDDVPHYNFAVAQYLPDGTVDTSFGQQGGFVGLDFDLDNDIARKVILQPDGKILVAGYAKVDGNSVGAVVRLDADGNPDPTFGTNGKATYSGGFSSANFEDLALLPDGRMVAVGTADQQMFVMRLMPDGQPDNTFDEDGVFTYRTASRWMNATAVGVRDDGRIFVAGRSFGSPEPFPILTVVGLDPDGTRLFAREDALYDGNPPHTRHSDDVPYALEVLSDGGFVIGGSIAYDQRNGGYVADMAVATFTENGVLLNLSGAQFGYAPVYHEHAYDLAIQPDGNIVVAGGVYGAQYSRSGIAWFHGPPKSGLNKTFSEDGRLPLKATPKDNVMYGIALQSNGDVVVVGSAMRDDEDFVVARIVGDFDRDGISEGIEDGSPNDGDGNEDGTPDRRQPHVASLPNATDGQYATLTSDEGTSFENMRAIENPSPGDAPDGIEFLDGFFQFSLADVAKGGSATVELVLHSTNWMEGYYVYGPTPDNPSDHWYEFEYDGTTGAEILRDRIILHFVDGLRGDSDLTANGRIVDPGGAAVTVNTPPTIAGTVPGQTVDDNDTIQPFSGVTISDAERHLVDVTVTLASAAEGVFTNLGDFVDQGNGVYSADPLTPTAATAALRALVFDPSANARAPGATVTTAFTITADDGPSAPVSDSATTVVVTSVNDAPSADVDIAAVFVDEGDVAVNSGKFTDVDLGDSVSLTASVGTVVQDSGGHGGWTWSFGTTDGPADSQSVTIESADLYGGRSQTTFDLIVRNLPPTAGDDFYTTDEATPVEVELLDGDTDPAGALDPLSVLSITPLGALSEELVATEMAEVGRTSVNHLVKTVALNRTFTNPVVIVQPPSYVGNDESIIRITDVGPASFNIRLVESPNMDVRHGTETIHYIVLEAGVWRLAGSGALVEAGTIDTDSNAPTFTPVSLDAPFAAAPVVLTQIQSQNAPTDSDATAFVKTRQRNTGAAGFEVALERAENGGIHPAETIGFVALESGLGTWDGHVYEAIVTDAFADATFRQLNFEQNYAAAPNFIAGIATYNDSDPVELRYRNADSLGLQVKAEEDINGDPEQVHGPEQVAYLAIEGSGVLVSQGQSRTFDPAGRFEHLALAETAQETITYTIGDGDGGTGTGTLTVTITGVNDAPNAGDDEATTENDSSITIDVLGNDTDADVSNPRSDVTAGETLVYNADVADDVDPEVWEGGITGFDFGFGAEFGTSVTLATGVSGLPGIDKAYAFTGAGGAETPSFEDVSGDPSDDSASWEVWFKPSDLSGNEVLFETGGTDGGMALLVEEDDVRSDVSRLLFVVQSGAEIQTQLRSGPLVLSEFSHALAVYERVADTDPGTSGDQAGGSAYLYLGGNLVDSVENVAGLTDWADGDIAGLAQQGGNSLGGGSGLDGFGSFSGQIAKFRFYESALSADETRANFETVVHRFSVTSVDTTGTAGLVTINPDNTIDYDPNGQFEWLAPGSTTTDEFRYTVSDGTGGTDTATVVVTVTVDTLKVVELITGPSSIFVYFDELFAPSALNLYDVEQNTLGPADVTLVNSSRGQIAGSLVIGTDSVTFVATGGPLPAGDYTLTLRSAADGFRDADGGLLDGNGDGTPGDDFVHTFTVLREPVVIGLPDFSRGPGQAVNVPADGPGLPVTLTDNRTGGEDIKSVSLTITYDATLLNISGATLGPDAPADATFTADTNTPGLVVLSLSSAATPLPRGSSSLFTLTGAMSASADYGRASVLSISDVEIVDAGSASVAATADEALFTAVYLGDSTGNGSYSGLDAQRAARVAIGLDGGFEAHPVVDPVIIADVTVNGQLSALDAQRIAQMAVGLDPVEIPPLPGAKVQRLSDTGIPTTASTSPRHLPIRGEGRQNAESKSNEWRNLPWVREIRDLASLIRSGMFLDIPFVAARKEHPGHVFTENDHQRSRVAGFGLSGPGVSDAPMPGRLDPWWSLFDLPIGEFPASSDARPQLSPETIDATFMHFARPND